MTLNANYLKKSQLISVKRFRIWFNWII